jgi:hypothetical protein
MVRTANPRFVARNTEEMISTLPSRSRYSRIRVVNRRNTCPDMLKTTARNVSQYSCGMPRACMMIG